MSGHGNVSYSAAPPHMAQVAFVPPWEPHGELAAPPYPQEYLHPDQASWNGDPGIYATPGPEIDPGIYAIPGPEIDPGIYATPGPEIDPGIYAIPVPADAHPGIRARPPMNAPSIVPGLDILRDALDERRDVSESTPPSAGGTDGVASMSLGDHMGGGARGFLMPSLVGGAVGGLLTAMTLRHAGYGVGLSSAAFAGKMLGHTALGLATGAAAGVLVAATSPTDSDSLAARYAVAGGLVGAGAGAAFPGGPNRALGAVLGGVSGAIVAGITGARLQRSAD